MALANVPTRLCAPTALTGTEATLYTASSSGSGTIVVVRNVHLVNTAGGDRQVSMSIGAYAAATAILTNLVVPANDALSLDVYIGMAPSETLRGSCTLSGGVTVTVMGVT